MEGKVCVLSFGVGSQMADVNQAIEDCMQAGHWLLLQNYHLAEEPNTSFFDLLKVRSCALESSKNVILSLLLVYITLRTLVL